MVTISALEPLRRGFLATRRKTHPSGSAHGFGYVCENSAERFSRDEAKIAYSVSSSKGIPSQYIPHFYYPSFEVIKLVSCSAQLSMEFIMLINVEMSTNSSHLTFISMINYDNI